MDLAQFSEQAANDLLKAFSAAAMSDAITQGLTTASSGVAGVGQTAGQGFAESLGTAISAPPTLDTDGYSEAGSEAGGAFADAADQGITAGDPGQAATQAITDGTGDAQSAYAELGSTLGSALTDQASQSISDGSSDISGAGTELGQAAVQGISTTITAGADDIGLAVTSAADAISNDGSGAFSDAGTDSGTAFGDALSSSALNKGVSGPKDAVRAGEPAALTSAATVGDLAGAAFAVALAEGAQKKSAAALANAIQAAEPSAAAAGTHAGVAAGAGASAAIGKAGDTAGTNFGDRLAAKGSQIAGKFGDSIKESLKSTAATVLPIAGVLGTAEIISSSVEAADALESSQDKVEAIFGDSAGAINAWSSNASSKLDLSKQSADDAATTFGTLFKSMGITGTTAAGMSENLVNVTANVAKFNNADPASVQTAVTSALKGRSAAIKQYGVDLSASTLAAEAQSHGLVTLQVNQAAVAKAQDTYNLAVQSQNKVDADANSTAADKKAALDNVSAAQTALANAMAGTAPALTDQQKGEAAYYAILDQTKNQQGAVAASSDTLASRKKQLGAEVTDLQAKFGQQLIPVLTKLAGFMLNNVVPALTATGNWIQKNKAWLEPLVVVLGGAVLAYKLVSTTMDAAAAVQKFFLGTTAEATVATEGQTAATAELDAAMDANPIGLIIAALAALVIGLGYAYTHSATFRDIIADVGNALDDVWKNVLSPVVDFFINHWQLALEIAGGPLVLLVTHFRDVEGAAQDVYGLISGLPGKIGNLAGAFLGAGASLMQGIFDGLRQGLNAAGGFASDIAQDVWNGIADFINEFLIDPIKYFSFGISLGPYHHDFQPFGGIPEVPQLAAGATVNPKSGGTLVNLAEAGSAETVVDTGLINRELATSANLAARALGNGGGQAMPTAEEYAAAVWAQLPDKITFEVDNRVLAKAAKDGQLAMNRRAA